MLSLVPSQSQAIQRIWSALGRADRPVLLTGEPGSGKTRVLDALVSGSRTLPIQLSGELIETRSMCLAHLILAAGLPSDATLDRLMAYFRRASVSAGQPDVHLVIEDAHCLPDAVFPLLNRLASDSTCRIVCVGESEALVRAAEAGVLFSTVQLPPWSAEDVRLARHAAGLDPLSDAALDSAAKWTRALSPSEWLSHLPLSDRNDGTLAGPQQPRPRNRRLRVLLMVCIAILVVLGLFAVIVLEQRPVAGDGPQTIPLTAPGKS